MAIYASDLYGSGSYGAQTYVDFDLSTFRLTPTDNQHMVLEWSKPGGSWTTFRLLRGLHGYASNENDGVILGEWESAGLPLEFTDYGQPEGVTGAPNFSLPPGVFVYYTVYLYTSALVWQRAGSLVGLVMGDHDYGDELYNLLPPYWHQMDRNTTTRYLSENGVSTPDLSEAYTTPLRRYLKVPGRELNYLRTEYDSLLWLKDPDRISGNMLPLLLQDLGAEPESALGVTQSRTLARNLVYLRKVRGTTPGVEGTVSAYSSWGATVTDGRNRVLTKDDSSFEKSIGTWSAHTNATITRSNAVGGQDGTYALQVTVTAAGLAYVQSCAIADVRTRGIPVKAGQAYTMSGYLQAAATARNCRWRYSWFDASGTLISDAFGSFVSNAVGSWTRVTATDTSPAGAVWLRLLLEVESTAAAGEVHYLDAVQVEADATATDYETPRHITVTLLPTRANLIPNPSFEVDTSGWQASGSATLTRSTSAAFVNTASVKVTATGSGDVGAELV